MLVVSYGVSHDRKTMLVVSYGVLHDRKTMLVVSYGVLHDRKAMPVVSYAVLHNRRTILLAGYAVPVAGQGMWVVGGGGAGLNGLVNELVRLGRYCMADFVPWTRRQMIQKATTIVLFGLCIFLALNMRSKSGYFNYQSELWADGAGYYVYLPATFIYGYNSGNFPDSIDSKMGHGFFLNDSSGIVRTKFTYGVALFELPFFTIAHLVAPVFKQPRNGFSQIYFKVMNVCIVFYLFIGLLMLVKYLKLYVKESIAYLTALIWLVTSQLYYYSIDDPGLSHVYSFMLFAACLYSLNRWMASGYKSRKYFLGLLVSSALIIVIRPPNVIFLLFLLFWDVTNKDQLRERFRHLFKGRNLITILAVFLVFLIPQMVYWYHLRGSPIIYSYGGESFSNWASPKIMEVWFSPSHGILFYSPIVILGIILNFFFYKNSTNKWLLFVLFITISLFFASWHSWSYGCGFGHRGFIEYQVLLSLPLAMFLAKLTQAKKVIQIVSLFGFVFLGALNIQLTYSFDGCWFGENIWDWKEYAHLLTNF